MMVVTDSRFDTSQWDQVEQSAQAGPSSLGSSSSHSDNEASSLEEEEEEEEEESDLSEDEPGQGEEEDTGPVVTPLSKEELDAFEKKQKRRGIVYISRIPPGMTPPKVRHLLSYFGEVERIYLQDGRKKQREAETGTKKKSTRRNTTFTEGWVEFSKKAVAKIVASTLNAQPIGFASGSRKANKNAKRWKDDVWTMKYLPGFKWHMLSEQMAHERAAHASRLRTELSQSKMEQADYLKKVERARVQKQKEDRRRQRAEATGATSAQSTEAETKQSDARIRTFNQRRPVLRDVRDQADAQGSADNAGRKRSSDSTSTPRQGQPIKKRRGEDQRLPKGTSDRNGGGLEQVLGKLL